MPTCPKCGGKCEVTKRIVTTNYIYDKCMCVSCNFVYGVDAKISGVIDSRSF